MEKHNMGSMQGSIFTHWKDEVLTHAAIWTSPEGTTLTGRRAQRATHCTVLCTWNARPRQIQREKVRPWWLQGWEGAERMPHRRRPRWCGGRRLRLEDRAVAMPARHWGRHWGPRTACHRMAHFKAVRCTLCGFHLGYSKNAEWWLAIKP